VGGGSKNRELAPWSAFSQKWTPVLRRKARRNKWNWSLSGLIQSEIALFDPRAREGGRTLTAINLTRFRESVPEGAGRFKTGAYATSPKESLS
jgi:hypothetical protein